MAPDDALLSGRWPIDVPAPPDAGKRYRVRVRDLVLTMSIGVHAHEKISPQRIRIGVELELDYPADGFPDGQYRKVFCYETLIGRIRAFAAEGHVILVETFAERIADLVLTDPRVQIVSVAVEKIDIYEDCSGVGATIKKFRT